MIVKHRTSQLCGYEKDVRAGMKNRTLVKERRVWLALGTSQFGDSTPRNKSSHTTFTCKSLTSFICSLRRYRDLLCAWCWEPNTRRLTRFLISGASKLRQLIPDHFWCSYFLLILHGMKLDMKHGNGQLRPEILTKGRPWKDKQWELTRTLGNPSRMKSICCPHLPQG